MPHAPKTQRSIIFLVFNTQRQPLSKVAQCPCKQGTCSSQLLGLGYVFAHLLTAQLGNSVSEFSPRPYRVGDDSHDVAKQAVTTDGALLTNTAVILSMSTRVGLQPCLSKRKRRSMSEELQMMENSGLWGVDEMIGVPRQCRM